ncbi:MAG: XRE family transcriptional regulator [Phenylobacterium sp.]|nr:XRE family transcriptional regulator [Phenylobacterium sp.]
MKAPDVRRRLAETGRTQVALARHLGKSKDSVSRLLNGMRAMDADELEGIKSFFGEDKPQEPTFVRVPVFGYAGAGSDDRIALASDQVLDFVELPAGMVRGEAFGVRVAGESMYPRLFSGETVVAERNVSPVRNREVVVELRDGTGLVKEYRGQKDGFLFLWQYNPEQEVRIPLTQVRAMHSAFRWR